MEIPKIQKKLVIRPSKNSLSKKNDLLHDKVTSRHQIFVVGKAYGFLGVRAKRIPKKRVHNEKTKKKQKKQVWRAGPELGSYVHCARQLDQQLTGTENWEGFCIFLARIDTQDADTCRDSHSISMQRSLKVSL